MAPAPATQAENVPASEVASARADSPSVTGWIAEKGALGWVLANLVTTAVYCVLGYAVSEFFSRFGLFPAPIWLPASVAVVAALLGGMRMFPGIFLGSFIFNYVLFAPPFYEAAIISITNGLGPIAGAALAAKFRPESGYFNRFSAVAAFIVCKIGRAHV